VSFRLHPDARDELREAVVFYDRAAERFVNAVGKAIAAIILKPDRFREFEPGARTCRVSKFPYSTLHGSPIVLVLGFFGVHPNPDPLFLVHGLLWTQSVFNLQRSKNDHENEDDDEDNCGAKHHWPPACLFCSAPSPSTCPSSSGHHCPLERSPRQRNAAASCFAIEFAQCTI
jgi:hypothetical protein